MSMIRNKWVDKLPYCSCNIYSFEYDLRTFNF